MKRSRSKKSKTVSSADESTIDDRVLRSKKAVLAATFQLLAEEGLSGVSIDEVAKRSGVAKTTVYRHWPSRSALLLDACSSLGGKAAAPNTGSVQGDLLALTTRLAKRLQTERWAKILPSMIDAAERDPEIAKLHTRLHAGYMAPFYEAIQRGKENDQLPGNVKPSEIVAALVGPLFYRRWFSREALDEPFVKTVVNNVMAQVKQ